MAEGSVDGIDVGSAAGWHKQLDDDLTWVGQRGRTSARSRSRWPALDQQMSDLHACYERACVED